MITDTDLKVFAAIESGATFSDIKERTQISSHSTIQRALRKLNAEELLEVKQERNLKKYSLKNTERAYSYKALAAEQLLQPIKKAINEINTALDNIEPLAIGALFGSRAKGKARKDSDIDIAIITEHTSEVKKAVEKIYNSVYPPLDVYVFTPGEFTAMTTRDEFSVGKEIKEHAVPFRNGTAYYRLSAIPSTSREQPYHGAITVQSLARRRSTRSTRNK